MNRTKTKCKGEKVGGSGVPYNRKPTRRGRARDSWGQTWTKPIGARGRGRSEKGKVTAPKGKNHSGWKIYWGEWVEIRGGDPSGRKRRNPKKRYESCGRNVVTEGREG